jgi:hypothetical protein
MATKRDDLAILFDKIIAACGFNTSHLTAPFIEFYQLLL